MNDIGFLCKEPPVNCTSPRVISSGHERDMTKIYSDEYKDMYTVGQDAILFCDHEGDPKPR